MLVAFDLDGTLHFQGAEGDVSALNELADYLRSKDVFTVLATGRSIAETLELKYIMDQLPVGAIVTNGGAQVYLRQGGSFVPDVSFSCPPNAIIDDVSRSVFSGLFTEESLIWLQEDRHQFPGKLSFYVRPEAVIRLRSRIAEVRALYPTFEYLITYNPEERGYHYFDVHPEESTKLAGVRHLARAVGVADEDVVYFGDNGNDLPCIRNFQCSALIDTYLDDLQMDAKDLNWTRVMKLKRGGAAAIVDALKEMR